MCLFVIKLLNYGTGGRSVWGNNIVSQIVYQYVLEQSFEYYLNFLYVNCIMCPLESTIILSGVIVPGDLLLAATLPMLSTCYV